MSIEQIALSRLVENAYEVFDKGLMAIAGRMILWGSFNDAEKLAKRYMQADGKATFEQSRIKNPKLTKVEFLSMTSWHAGKALEYKKWARDHNGQPIYFEALVTYCASFENFLKAVSVAFDLAKGSTLNRQIFVPSNELTQAYKRARSLWDGCEGNRRFQEFYEQHVVARTPIGSLYQFPLIVEGEWQECIDIFRLRNAILHNMARLAKDATVGDDFFILAKLNFGNQH